MKLRRYQYNGVPFVAIVDNYDCPVDPFVSCYLNSLGSKAANTRLRFAHELLFVLKHFGDGKRQIDLAARVASEKFISNQEYMQFYEHCFFQKNSVHEGSVVLFPSIEDKRLRNVIAANQRGLAKVANQTALGRIRRLRQFLEWLFKHFHDAQNVNSVTSDNYDKLIAKIKLDERGIGRNGDQKVGNPEDSVIPDELFARLLEMVVPSSPNNPFKSSKVRNYLIVNLLIQTGIRRGAVGKIKISDCHFDGSYDRISIYPTRNDPSDPRLEKANQKSKAHLATIDPALMKDIKFYIDHIRSQFPQKQPHDFLLVSEKDSKGTVGQPLSLKSINAIFEKLSKALGFRVHPHLLRHKWNEIFDKEGEKKGVNEALLEDIRKYAMGWSQNSTMSQIYNSKRLAVKARELSKAHQHRIDSQT
jgi:integrase